MIPQLMGLVLSTLTDYPAIGESGIFVTFASLRSPEYHPRSKITGEILEPVLNIGRHKKTITRFEWMGISTNNEFTRSPMDKIDFILFMRSLRVIAGGGVVLNRHGPVGKSDGEWLTHRPLHRDGTRDAGEYFFNGYFGFQWTLLTEQIASGLPGLKNLGKMDRPDILQRISFKLDKLLVIGNRLIDGAVR